MFHKVGKAHLSKVKSLMKGAGYKSGGDAKGKKIVSDAVHKHEKHDHKDMPLTKLKSGGKADGKKSHARLDKIARGSKNKKRPTKVNVIVAPEKEPVPVPVIKPVPKPIPVPVGPSSPQPPMAPAGAGPVPGGAGVIDPTQPPMNRGGKVKCYKKGGAVKMTAGAASGEGRLEKTEIQRKDRKGK